MFLRKADGAQAHLSGAPVRGHAPYFSALSTSSRSCSSTSGRVPKGDRIAASIPECNSAPWRPPLSRQRADAEPQPQGTCAVSLPLPALLAWVTAPGRVVPAASWHLPSTFHLGACLQMPEKRSRRAGSLLESWARRRGEALAVS